MNETTLKIVLTVIVALHFAGNLWHGDAHATLEVALPTYKSIYVGIVIVVGPIIGAALLWTRYFMQGCLVVALCMLGSVLFSVYHHFVMVSDDNVHFLPPGAPEDHVHFTDSAILIAVLALAGAVFAFYVIGKQASIKNGVE